MSSHPYVSIVFVVHTCVTMDPSVGISEIPQVHPILPIPSPRLPPMIFRPRQSISKAFMGRLGSLTRG
jgi:hypothetical protein